jgi:4-hydroxy-tetrahydrodipicolinate reductase
VLIDVTNLEFSERAVSFALAHGLNVVVGTSGWNADRLTELEGEIPADRGVLVVPNFSVGSVLSTHLAAIAGRFFDSIEVIEAHHDRKIDSPSGTAVRTAEAIAAARDTALEPPFADQTARGEVVAGIPVHSMRLRGVVADQQVILGGVGEVVTIRHETLSPGAYSHGIELALRQSPDLRGLTVGLDALLGLESGR